MFFCLGQGLGLFLCFPAVSHEAGDQSSVRVAHQTKVVLDLFKNLDGNSALGTGDELVVDVGPFSPSPELLFGSLIGNGFFESEPIAFETEALSMKIASAQAGYI